MLYWLKGTPLHSLCLVNFPHTHSAWQEQIVHFLVISVLLMCGVTLAPSSKHRSHPSVIHSHLCITPRNSRGLPKTRMDVSKKPHFLGKVKMRNIATSSVMLFPRLKFQIKGLHGHGSSQPEKHLWISVWHHITVTEVWTLLGEQQLASCTNKLHKCAKKENIQIYIPIYDISVVILDIFVIVCIYIFIKTKGITVKPVKISLTQECPCLIMKF